MYVSEAAGRGVVGAPVQRRALAHLVLLIFDAAPGAGYLALCIK